MGPQPGLPEPKWRGCLAWKWGSGILFSDPLFPPDPADPADPAEMVSGAAVQTLPNHAQESQDDVSSQANSLKLWDEVPWGSIASEAGRGTEILYLQHFAPKPFGNEDVMNLDSWVYQ